MDMIGVIVIKMQINPYFVHIHFYTIVIFKMIEQ
jgi:hypothetical protein